MYVHGKKVVTGFRERLYDSVHGQKSAVCYTVALGGHWDVFRTSKLRHLLIGLPLRGRAMGVSTSTFCCFVVLKLTQNFVHQSL